MNPNESKFRVERCTQDSCWNIKGNKLAVTQVIGTLELKSESIEDINTSKLEALKMILDSQQKNDRSPYYNVIFGY